MTQPNTKTPAMVLQEFTVKRGFSPPEYNLVMSKMGTHNNEFHYQVFVANICGKGFGRSKQVAKHDAASKALEILAQKGLYDSDSNPVQEFNAQAHRNESDSPLQPSTNHIGTLTEICNEFKLPYPIFIEISDVGPPHCRVFTYECRLGSMITQATANTKKQAKQLAAKDMFGKIKNVCPELSQQSAEIANALTETDEEAIKLYADFSLSVVQNRSLKIEDFTTTFKKVMHEKKLTKEDFEAEFQNRSDESFKSIMNRLGVKYEVMEINQSPAIVSLVFGLESPFSVLAMGSTKEVAEKNAISETFTLLDIYMNVDYTFPSHHNIT